MIDSVQPSPFSPPFEPISLGYACEVKYQLSRSLYFRTFPDGAEHEFRRMLLTDDYGDKVFVRNVFDFQITPFEALLAYLETDFRGVYEREDFQVSADGAEVEHRRLKTRHPHEFHAVDGVLDEAAIDRGYPAARSKFEHLAERFRRHLATAGPCLYVFNQIRIYDEAVRLAALLRARNRDHAFKLLFVGADGEDQMLDALKGEVFKAWTTADPDKPADRRWEGDDVRWDALLRPFDLRAPAAARIRRTLDETLADCDAEPPGASSSIGATAGRSLLGRFLKRARRAGAHGKV